jgi:hypothetical protein
MGKAVPTSNSSVTTKKTNTATSKAASSNSSVQRKKKSRSCSTRRLSVTTDPSNIVRGDVYGNRNQINSQSDMSDDAGDPDAQPHNVPRQISGVFKYATKISQNEFKCNECSKVKLSY